MSTSIFRLTHTNNIIDKTTLTPKENQIKLTKIALSITHNKLLVFINYAKMIVLNLDLITNIINMLNSSRKYLISQFG